MVISPTTKTTLLIGLKIAHNHTHTMRVQDHNRQSALRKNRKEVGGDMYKQTKWMNVLLGT